MPVGWFQRSALAVITFVILAGCFQPDQSETPVAGEDPVEPASWKKTCDFVIDGDLEMPCRFDRSERLTAVPDNVVCTSAWNLEEAQVRFLRDPVNGNDYLEYHTTLEPISVVVADSGVDGPAVVTLADAPKDGYVYLGPTTLDPHYFVGIYHDELLVGPDQHGPEDGVQEFYRFNDSIYTIHRWEIDNETRYIGETDPDLVPRGLGSWSDTTGDDAVYVSMRSFLVTDQLPAVEPDRCVATPRSD